MDKTIPRKDADYDVKQQIISEAVLANMQAWNLDEKQREMERLQQEAEQNRLEMERMRAELGGK
jgi:hypothetical protein